MTLLRTISDLNDLAKMARSQELDLDWVEKLRKDFLTLMRNLPKVGDYKTAIRLSDAFITYRKNFYLHVFHKFLDTELKARDLRDSPEAKYIDKKVRGPGWDFYIQLQLPISRAYKEVPEDMQFVRYQESVDAWEKKTKREAADFWKVMKEVIQYSRQKFTVEIPDVENQEIEGFHVQVHSFDANNERHHDELGLFRAALRIYRKQATDRMPLLLRKQCPIVLDFEGGGLDLGGEYKSEHGGVVYIYSHSSAKHPGVLAKTIAHETGHHLYRTYLSGHDREFWESAILQNYGDLKLEDLLRVWNPEDAYVFELSEILAETHPIIALQIQAWLWGEGNDHGKSMEKQKKDYYYDLWFNKNVETIKVPRIPITGYAGKNPEESFCEAVGLLVAYGPRAVHEVILSWLKTILPGQVRTANLQRIASNLELLFCLED